MFSNISSVRLSEKSWHFFPAFLCQNASWFSRWSNRYMLLEMASWNLYFHKLLNEYLCTLDCKKNVLCISTSLPLCPYWRLKQCPWLVVQLRHSRISSRNWEDLQCSSPNRKLEQGGCISRYGKESHSCFLVPQTCLDRSYAKVPLPSGYFRFAALRKMLQPAQ